MDQQDLIAFRNEQNRAETEAEFLAFLLYGLRKAQNEGNELLSQDIAQDAKRMEEAKDWMMKADEYSEVHSSLLSAILDEIHKKDIDLSGVIAALDAVRAEIEAGRQEERDTEPMEQERHKNVLEAISALIEATRESKPEPVDLTQIVDKTDETAKKTHELLSALLAELSMLDVKPEVKIDIPKEVEVKEPKWYKPFAFDTKWLKPIEYAINAINPKPAIARLETTLEKILKRPFPKVPLTKDGSRVLVEVDRTGGGGSGIINKVGDPINPATEEKQDILISKATEQSIPSGAKASGQRDLAAANTWYTVPSIIPNSDYLLTATLETSVGTIRWSPDGTGSPSATNGHKADGTIARRMKAGTALYFGSDVAGDDVNWSTEII